MPGYRIPYNKTDYPHAMEAEARGEFKMMADVDWSFIMKSDATCYPVNGKWLVVPTHSATAPLWTEGYVLCIGIVKNVIMNGMGLAQPVIGVRGQARCGRDTLPGIHGNRG
jgi:hypothetical protein